MSGGFTPPNGGILFERDVPDIGRLSLRPLRLRDDGALIHDWVTRDYARYWLMGDKSEAEVAAVYEAQIEGAHTLPLMGLFENERSFLVETYDPAYDEVGEHYAVATGDRGMHVLVGPTEKPIPGFTQAVFRTVMEFMFSEPTVDRVVVEPDARNDKIHVLNRRYGFVYDREIDMRAKRASLAFCTRNRFLASCAAAVPA